MKRKHFIALDVHCQFVEAVVMTESGRITRRERCPTEVPALRSLIQSVCGSREVVMEEGPLADWLLRSLAGCADAVVACDPRRNHLIARDSDKDDPIDAEKLGHLYRGGYVKLVHHPESLDRQVFKRLVALYHDGVRERVRRANRVMGELRQYGVFVTQRAFKDAARREERATLLSRLPDHPLVRACVESLLRSYDAVVRQTARQRKLLIREAAKEPQIVRFTALPGVKWIRAATFFAYVDTPWRFHSVSALYKYMGIGLERRHSGAGPEQLKVAQRVNRPLKNMILGAAKSAIRSGTNPFAERNVRWLDAGLTPRVARRSTARSLAAVMWGMFKNGSVYRPELVGAADKVSALMSTSKAR